MSRSKRSHRLGSRALARATRDRCSAAVAAGWHFVRAYLRPWRPVVLVDARRGRARRLRRAIAGTTRAQLRALGVTPPVHLLVVVQRTVVEQERPLAALLQVFEDEASRRRHVLFLALAVHGRQLSDDDVLATLRQQLQRVVAAELGPLTLSVATEPARARSSAAIVPLRRTQHASPFDDEVPPPEAFEGYDDGAFAVAAER